MHQEQVQGFVDIHTHILQGVDDGARDLKEAMALLTMARDNGTTHVVLTPHYRGRWRSNTPAFLQERFEALRAEAAKTLPEMTLYLGNEAGNEPEIGEKVAEGCVLSLNGSHYVLLEFDYGCSRIQLINGVMDVIGSGYTPVIAHAERYDVMRKNKKLAQEVLEVGALIQLNADSVMGKCGLGAKLCCCRLLKRGMVHFIASDAHDTQERTPVLRECFRYVSKRWGEDYAWELFRDNALSLLTGRWR